MAAIPFLSVVWPGEAERLTSAMSRTYKCKLVVDGWEFDSPLDAALHLLWLLQRLSYYEKHRQGIIASRKLLRKLKYKVGELKRPNDPS